MVIVWKIDIEEKLFQIEDLDKINTSKDLVWSPDNQYIIVTSNQRNTFTIFDGATGQLIREVNEYDLSLTSSLSLSTDGKTLVTGNYSGNVILWDHKTGQEILQLYGFPNSVWDVEFYDRNTKVATVGYSATGRMMVFWDIETQSVIKIIHSNKAINQLAWSPDGSLLASNDNQKIILWDVQNNSIHSSHNVIESTFKETRYGEISDLSFSPNKNTLAFAWGDDSNGIQYLDIDTGEIIPGPNPNAAYVFDWSSDGTKIVTIPVFRFSDEYISISDIATNEELATAPDIRARSTKCIWSPAGNYIAAASYTNILLFDEETLDILQTIEFTPTEEDFRGLWIRDIALSPDGTKIVVGTYDNLITVVEAESGEILWQYETQGQIKSIDWSPTENQIAAAISLSDASWEYYYWYSKLSEVVLLNAETGRPTRTYPNLYNITDLIFSPDGTQLAIGSSDGTIRIFYP